MFRTLIYLTLTCTLTTPALGQGYFDVRTDLMESENVMAVTAIWDITFVVPLDALSTKASNNAPMLDGVCSVSSAVKAGLPSAEMNKVLTTLLGTRHAATFRSATLEDFGSNGFAWTITWSLFPETGGFTGIPFKWKAVVSQDGEVVSPHLFLQSHFESDFEPDKTVFCTLPMASLTSAPPSLAGQKLEETMKLASQQLHAAFRKTGYTERFRIAETRPMRYPGAILGVSRRDNDIVAWSLQFVEIDSESENPHEFTVWADDRGQLGEFTIGGWQPKFDEPNDELKSR